MTSRLTRAALILTAGILLALVPMTGVAVADDCVALGGVLGGGECTISGVTAAKTGTFNLDETLRIKNGGNLKVAPAGITINIQGDLQMEAGSQIDGDVFTAIPGAPITIKATGDIHLAGAPPAGSPVGAIIHSNSNNTSCAGSAKGGTIKLTADSDLDLSGNFVMDPGSNTSNGSKVSSISSCGLGEIVINGNSISINGDVLSQGTTTKGRGGPITVNAACFLTITDFGSVISLGVDPGADLVHLQGGCDVKIFGLVASTGPGHIGGVNKCQPPNRPGRPANSQACVEIWAGNSLTIDSKFPHNGEINADTGFSGGATGIGWIELLSRGPITIIGDSAAPFAVHANQGVTNGHGGLVTVISKEDGVTISGNGIQVNDTAAGGQGGTATILAKLDVNLTGPSRNEAKGSAGGGGAQHGGTLNIRSFGTGAGNGSIIATANSILDVTGRTPPDGKVNLTACVAFGFPPGAIVPAAIVPLQTTDCTGGSPDIPPPAVLPLCICGEVGCPCVTSFNFVTGSSPKTVRINGISLKAVTEVRLSPTSCEPTAGTVVPPIGATTNSLISVNANGVAAGSYHIITLSAGGSCCSAGTVTIP